MTTNALEHVGMHPSRSNTARVHWLAIAVPRIPGCYDVLNCKYFFITDEAAEAQNSTLSSAGVGAATPRTSPCMAPHRSARHRALATLVSTAAEDML